jgi:predicted amidophosphoribosyltransferase
VDVAWAAGPYEGIVRDLAVALKFGSLVGLAGLAAEIIAAGAPPALLDGVIVPVPPAPSRMRRRGFDPATEIASALGRLTGLECVECLRRDDGPAQVGRARIDRTTDPPTPFARGPAPRRVVLVDDVHTTGATLGACARALRRGGCGHVAAVTFARAG